VAEQWNAWSATTDALFGPGTVALLELLRLQSGERVLELAAGSGGLTLPLARAVGPDGHVLATDLGPKLLEFAARNARAAGLRNVSTRVMDGQRPDVPDASIDVVACRQGLMLFPDPAVALEGLLRVLRPGGRIGLTVFTTPERNGFLSTPAAAFARWAPPPVAGAPPGPGPFSLGAPGLLESMLLRTGFRDVQHRVVSSWFRPASVEEMTRFYREVVPGLAAQVPEPDRDEAWRQVARSLEQYVAAGSSGVPCELLVVRALRPDGTGDSAGPAHQ
jgi:SAM-dependent methyltransferase